MNVNESRFQDAHNRLNREAFGSEFSWGVSASAYQTEGAWQEDGKGPSIWDTFSHRPGTILNNETGDCATDFYHRYRDDLLLMRGLGIRNFRFSISWPRVLPNGVGSVNQKGLDYYKRLVDESLEHGIEPWVTLYHWDLPQALEDRGGWTNRDIIGWFGEYTELCARHLGDRVKHWMVLNEPMVFTGAGHFLGVHAPGRKGITNFLPAVHHAALAQAVGGRTLKAMLPEAEIGTTFSCSHVDPIADTRRHRGAVTRVDTLLNRLFLEPALGMGYPTDRIPALKRLERYMRAGDEERLAFDFDFIGIQNYTREVVRYSLLTPWLRAKLLKADDRDVPHTLMNWEVYPESIYQTLKLFASYPGVKKIIVTENGAAFADKLVGGRVQDTERTEYLKGYIGQVLRARNEGVPVEGYFVWTFTDNFEWAEGFAPRFGLVHVDFETQERNVKDSGKWYSGLLRNDPAPAFPADEPTREYRSV